MCGMAGAELRASNLAQKELYNLYYVKWFLWYKGSSCMTQEALFFLFRASKPEKLFFPKLSSPFCPFSIMNILL
jgi:hypothetical protein